MHEENKAIIFIKKTLHFFTVIFTFVLFVILFVKLAINGYLNGNNMLNFTYCTILQIAGLALILAINNTIIMSDIFIVKMRFLLRLIIFLITTLLIVTPYTIFFKWLDLSNKLTLISYILIFILCFTIDVAITLLKFKSDNKKYKILLEKYKSRYNQNSD